MRKHINLAKAVKLASATMIMGAVMLPLSLAQAEEEQLNSQLAVEESEEEVEEVFVTGSRIATTVADTPRPVTVLSSESLEAAGMENIADVLRNTSYNTMGSYREQSGSSFGGAALINLKGLGEEYTAVLINGRRVPGNPFTGSSAVDLSTIPMSAVERVEILTDSASAVYGADAIGGVINVIMKTDFDGTIFEISTSRPERDDANLDNVKATFGSSSEEGSVLFSIDWQKKGYIADSDRDFSGVNFLSDAPIPTDGVDVTGANGGGNTGFAPDFSSAFIVGDCDEDYYLEMLNPFGVTGTGCGYKYSDVSVMTMGVERFSTFMDARRKIGGGHEVYLENRTTLAETFGRFAPAIGPFTIDAAAPINDQGADYVLYHRFVGHGPRDDYARISEFDTVGGINGTLFDDTINYDLSARRYNYAAASFGNNYVLKSVIADLVTSGDYDPTDPNDPSNADAITLSKASISRDLGTEVSAFYFTFDGMTEVAGFGIGWAAGLEQSSEDYQDKYDSYREAQNVIGASGNTSEGSRERWAAFGEAQVNITEDFNVNLAVRYDDYNDFGGNVSPQISARYALGDRMTVRASAGKGFKAPNLGDMYSLYARDAQQGLDTTRCAAQVAAGQLASEDDCASTQLAVYTGGNPELEAEESTSFNVGIVLEPIDDLLVSIDYYSLTIDDVVVELEVEDIFALEQAGNLPDGVVVNRGASDADGVPGIVTLCASDVPPNCGLINVFANLDKREVAGADLRLEYTVDTAIGTFRPELHWSHVTEYKETTIAGEIDRLGSQNGDKLYPTDRANLSLAYDNGPLSVHYLYNWISEVDATSGGKFEAWDMHTVNASYETAEDVTLSLGIRNLTDEDPSVDTNAGWNAGTSQASLSMYDIGGRTFLASVKVEF